MNLSPYSILTDSKATKVLQYGALAASVVGSQTAVSCISNKRRWTKVALSVASTLIGAVVYEQISGKTPLKTVKSKLEEAEL